MNCKCINKSQIRALIPKVVNRVNILISTYFIDTSQKDLTHIRYHIYFIAMINQSLNKSNKTLMKISKSTFILNFDEK